MQITVARSGGYAGIAEEPTTVDTDQLDEEAKDRLERLVGESRFFSLPSETGGVGADMFQYEISVADDGRRHTVTFADDGSPETEPLRQLVEAVSTAA